MSCSRGVPDEVPHDHEVAGKLHLLDAVDLAVQARFVVGDGLAQQAAAREMRDGGVEALAQALAADLLEVAVDGLAGGNGEFGERIVDLVQLEVAALGELHGAACTTSGAVGEEPCHLVGAS